MCAQGHGRGVVFGLVSMAGSCGKGGVPRVCLGFHVVCVCVESVGLASSSCVCPLFSSTRLLLALDWWRGRPVEVCNATFSVWWWSFSRDLRWLIRHRHGDTQAQVSLVNRSLRGGKRGEQGDFKIGPWIAFLYMEQHVDVRAHTKSTSTQKQKPNKAIFSFFAFFIGSLAPFPASPRVLCCCRVSLSIPSRPPPPGLPKTKKRGFFFLRALSMYVYVCVLRV